MNFFKILHLLMTSPAHLVYEAKMTTVKKLLLKLVATMLFVVVLSSLFNTYKSIVYLPAELSKMFPGTAITDGALKADSSYTVHAWQLSKIKSAISGMSSSVDTIGGAQIAVSNQPVKNSSVPFQLHSGGVITDKKSIPLPGVWVKDTLSWSELFSSEQVDFDFSEDAFRTVVTKNSLIIFILSLLSNVFNMVILSLYLYILLGFVFFFSSLRGLISREERARMVLIALLPLYIMLPVFTTAGAGWDYFMPLCLILSSIVLGRALAFRRKTEFSGDENE